MVKQRVLPGCLHLWVILQINRGRKICTRIAQFTPAKHAIMPERIDLCCGNIRVGLVVVISIEDFSDPPQKVGVVGIDLCGCFMHVLLLLARQVATDCASSSPA
ncbi:hypothetical protein [Cypionkella sinensis]|uniref:hypothetical protein n=1 Tax=Cypionkella sinensis TaxID=1756043 RepID=UPI003638A942